jgi:hypothetical protein
MTDYTKLNVACQMQMGQGRICGSREDVRIVGVPPDDHAFLCWMCRQPPKPTCSCDSETARLRTENERLARELAEARRVAMRASEYRAAYEQAAAERDTAIESRALMHRRAQAAESRLGTRTDAETVAVLRERLRSSRSTSNERGPHE